MAETPGFHPEERVMQAQDSIPGKAVYDVPILTEDSTPKKSVYFGYGSNLWLDQMHRRCPESKYLGVGRLDGYRWMIMERGYANVVFSDPKEGHVPKKEAPRDSVYGLLYELNAADEAALDQNEGVPWAYTKENTTTHVWWPVDGAKVNVNGTSSTATTLVYIDKKRIKDSQPKDEYIARMNHGINDAVEKGVPQKYVDDVMRKFIPVR
ncbi:MAG: hypothetical protein M1828_006443 [Chrysothrix sp. TS-e1954]|nr:MAG: hypothetical protein M1828_006443 [Chrysothrix sp. TS-e1954]